MWKTVTVLLASAWVFSALPCCAAPATPARNILVLREGWENWPSNAMVSTHLQEVFGNDSTFDKQLFQEYVDEWRLGRSIPEMAEALHRKYAAQKFDLIVAVGFTPFNMLLSQGAKFFPGVPAVFVSVGDFEFPQGGLPKNMTGVIGHVDVAGTVELALGSIVLHNEPGIWERYHWYIVGAIAIVLLQALLIAALMAQARRRAAAERTVKRRLEFETLISETSARFINLPPDRIPAEIERGLDRVRSFVNVDRISLYDRSKPGMDFRALFYATQENSALMFPLLTRSQFPWTMKQLKEGQALLVERMDQLPPEAVAEREVAQRGIKSFAVIPLMSAGSVLGLLLLATTSKQRGWPRELVRQLQILGDIFYQAVLRQRAEEAARESEERFVLVADSAPMMVWMSGTDKLCTYVNKGWLDFTGRTLEQELGDGWTTSVHPDDRERCLSGYAQAFDARQEFKLEYRLRRHDGQYRWIMDCGVPRFSPDLSFCGYIGSCIDITDLKLSQQEMEELSGRLIHAQEEERKRLARELHDNFGQRLVVLSMELAQHLSNPENPPQIEAFLRDLGAKLKEISRAMNVTAHQLHSAHLEVLGLVSAIQGLCHEFSRQYGIEASFSHAGVPSPVPAEVALCLFRVVQEGLQNIAKHSGATSCQVELTGSREGIHLRISDPGVGFDPARLKLKPGLGFVSMRERLRLVGGQITVESQESQGTRLDIRVPAAMTTAA